AAARPSERVAPSRRHERQDCGVVELARELASHYFEGYAGRLGLRSRLVRRPRPRRALRDEPGQPARDRRRSLQVTRLRRRRRLLAPRVRPALPASTTSTRAVVAMLDRPGPGWARTLPE